MLKQLQLTFWVLGTLARTRTILGAFAKLRKTTFSVVMSVRPFVRMEQLGSNWTDFHEISYMSFFFESLSRKFKFN